MLILGMTRFRDYLLVRELPLVRNHKSLLGLLRSDRPTPSMAAARFQCWAIQPDGYRYKLE